MSGVVAIIPARGGSKGILKKNIALCAGKPLLWWTLDAVQESKLVDHAFVSTDDEEIALSILDRGKGVLSRKIWHFSRPSHLAQDDTPTEPVMQNVLDNLERPPELIVLLQPTSPVRTGAQIDHAIELMDENPHIDSLVSVVKSHCFHWKEQKDGFPQPYYHIYRRPRRQDMSWDFQENGSIYITRWEAWQKSRNRMSGNIQTYVMPDECGIQVDTPLDLEVASLILEKRLVAQELVHAYR